MLTQMMCLELGWDSGGDEVGSDPDGWWKHLVVHKVVMTTFAQGWSPVKECSEGWNVSCIHCCDLLSPAAIC